MCAYIYIYIYTHALTLCREENSQHCCSHGQGQDSWPEGAWRALQQLDWSWFHGITGTRGFKLGILIRRTFLCVVLFSLEG